MSFASLSLRSKLLAGFIFVALIGGAVGAVGVLDMRKIDEADMLLYSDVASPLGDIGAASTHFQRMRSNVFELLLEKNPAERPKIMQKVADRRKSVEEEFAPFEKTLHADEDKEEVVLAKEFHAAFGKFNAIVDRAYALMNEGKAEEALAVVEKEGNKDRTIIQDALEKLQEVREAEGKEIATANSALADKAQALMLGLAIFNTIAAIGIGLLLARSVGAALGRISSSLKEGSTQVESASGQLTGSSQAMAEGSSESAASLEETASAMEEMSAMTKRNAESAGEAKSLSDRAAHSVDKANSSMETLVGRMGEISSAGQEIGKIIKTIDEIAFQTNLLALNAAVEAARAGEAGAGFAVVADEVRNLAQRAAGAAKNTSDLIEGVIRKIQDGTQLVEKTADDFGEVASSVKKVAELVGEVSAASSEQTRGISEVSSAISQMDKVTQSNAASAEEVASASEELNAQALSLQEIVTQLETLIAGDSGGGSVSASRSSRVAPPAGRRQARALGGGNSGARKTGGGKALARMTKPAASKSPEDIIPLDDMNEF